MHYKEFLKMDNIQESTTFQQQMHLKHNNTPVKLWNCS